MRLTRRLLLKSVLISVICGVALLQLYRQRVPPAFNLPAAASVRTQHPIVGVHTRLMGLDEPTIRRTLQQVREMGATTIIDLFPWAVIQPRSANSYEWTGSDMLIAHAQRQGLTVIARLDFVPAWARPANTSDRYLDPDHYAAYADFVVAFAQRYVPQGVQVLQIWNEPNLRFEWGDRAPDPVAYANLLKVVYPRVKAVAPEALITLAGLAPGGPTGLIDPQTLSVNDLTFLKLCLAEKPPFDAVSVHAYGSINPAEQAPDLTITNFRRTELIYDLVLAAGYRFISPRAAGTITPVGQTPCHHQSVCKIRLLRMLGLSNTGHGCTLWAFGNFHYPILPTPMPITTPLSRPMAHPRRFIMQCKHLPNNPRNSSL